MTAADLARMSTKRPGDGSIGIVDERAAVLAIRVAEAADAWMSDPRDVMAYERLVTTVVQFRTYRHPQLDVTAGADSAVRGESLDGDLDEILDELADRSPPAPVGTLLKGGDAQQILGELRRRV
jgi:hypothetical protein